MPHNFLDDLLDRFRERWITQPQFRAMASGVVALVVLVGLCTCGAITSAITNNALAGAGFGPGGSSGQPQGGGGVLQAAAEFPTPTIAPWPTGVIPGYQPVPASQTPIPTPTPVPTATPWPTATTCISNCGGGGGPTVQLTITGWAPSPWTECAGGAKCLSVTVHTSVPYDGVNLIITRCDGLQVLNNSGGAGAATDGSGNYTFTFTQANPTLAHPHPDIWATAQNGAQNGVHATPACA
jgi:hypothetical protein